VCTFINIEIKYFTLRELNQTSLVRLNKKYVIVSYGIIISVHKNKGRLDKQITKRGCGKANDRKNLLSKVT